jgi:hypothetical protein
MQQPSNMNQEKAMDLLKMNYDNLHFSYWECHKVYWTMTSIFLPLTLTAFMFIIKDVPKTNIATLALSWVVVFSLLTYWFRSSQYLDSFNDTRRDRLVLLENQFNALDCAFQLDDSDKNKDFYKQYTLPYKGGLKKLTLALYLVLISGTLGIIIAKMTG